MTKKASKIAVEYDKNAVSNRYKANQWLIDPRQELFWKLYIDPESDTFGNCYQSAILAKYEPNYAKELTNRMPKWLVDKVEKVNDEGIIQQAEKNIKEVLNLNTTNNFSDKKTGKVYQKLDSDLLRIKDNTSRWALERLNKDKYSSRTEHISKNLNIIQKIESNIKDIAGNKDRVVSVDADQENKEKDKI